MKHDCRLKHVVIVLAFSINTVITMHSFSVQHTEIQLFFFSFECSSQIIHVSQEPSVPSVENYQRFEKQTFEFVIMLMVESLHWASGLLDATSS